MFWIATTNLAFDDDLPPTEGTTFDWVFEPDGDFPVGIGQVDAVTITNPNSVDMTITWTEFSDANFDGPSTPITIPPKNSATMYASCYGGLGTDSTNGAWATSGGNGYLAGTASNI